MITVYFIRGEKDSCPSGQGHVIDGSEQETSSDQSIEEIPTIVLVVVSHNNLSCFNR